jgi:hypothetical protein
MNTVETLHTKEEFYSEVAYHFHKKALKWPTHRTLRRWRSVLELEPDDLGFYYGSDLELMKLLADQIARKPRQKLTISAHEARERRNYAREKARKCS